MSDKQQLFGFYRGMASLDQGESTILEYVWIDGSGLNMRSKSRVIKKLITSIEEIPDWNYDGSSC